MNDRPKPVTDCSAEATQSTGEWTAQTVNRLLDDDNEQSWQVVADAHNAAVAAAKGAQHHMEACRALLYVPDDEVLYGAIEDLQQQLAAEKEKLKTANYWEAKEAGNAAKLREQLAEERENTDLWKRQSAFESEHRDKYRGRVQTLVDALKKIRQLTDIDMMWDLASEALAKVKEGK